MHINDVQLILVSLSEIGGASINLRKGEITNGNGSNNCSSVSFSCFSPYGFHASKKRKNNRKITKRNKEGIQSE